MRIKKSELKKMIREDVNFLKKLKESQKQDDADIEAALEDLNDDDLYNDSEKNINEYDDGFGERYDGKSDIAPGTILQGRGFQMKCYPLEGDYVECIVIGKEHLKPNRIHKDSLKHFPIVSKGEEDVVAEAQRIIDSWKQNKLQEKKSKPDYLDIDNDNDREESMKKAAKAKSKLKEYSDPTQANFDDLSQVVENIAHIERVGKHEAAMIAIEYIAEQYSVRVEFDLGL